MTYSFIKGNKCLGVNMSINNLSQLNFDTLASRIRYLRLKCIFGEIEYEVKR